MFVQVFDVEMGVVVLEVCLAVRGQDGVLVDPGAVGVEGLISLIRADSPGAPAPGYAAFGVSVDVLEAVEVVLGQVTALRAAAVHAVAADTPAGVVGDQVVDVRDDGPGPVPALGLFLREQALLLTHQPQVWAALWDGRLDVTKAGILARALYLVPRPGRRGPGAARVRGGLRADPGLRSDLRRRAHRRAAGPAPHTPAGGGRPGRGA